MLADNLPRTEVCDSGVAVGVVIVLSALLVVLVLAVVEAISVGVNFFCILPTSNHHW